MRKPELLPHETERLTSLFRYNLLDTYQETEFDEIVAIAARLFGVEIALISLVDDNRQWFKAKIGLAVCETSRDISFCGHALHSDDIFEVPDALVDERFSDNPLVINKPNIRFYAGQPIQAEDGYKLGTLCLLDSRPRSLTPIERDLLKMLARIVERLIISRHEFKKKEEKIQLLAEQIKSLEHSNSMKAQLLSKLFHDLKSPLVNRRAAMERLKVQISEINDSTESISEVFTGFNRMEEKILQSLEKAIQDLQTQSVVMEPFAVESITDYILLWCQDPAQQKDIQLHFDLEAGLQALGNLDLVRIVLRKLAINAIKYCRRGDTVTLFSHRYKQYVELGVEDTGLGIKPETLEQIRNHIYQQSLPSRTANGTITGLGLYETYLNQMGTSLEIESSWAEGSIFSFRLLVVS